MGKKLKICHIGWAHSMHVKRITQFFAKNAYDISIITSSPKEIDGVKAYQIPSMPRSFKDTRPRFKRYLKLSFNDYKVQKIRFQIWRILWIRRTIKDINPDIVHSHSLWYPGYLGIYITGYPFVLTVLNGDVLWNKDDINHYDKGFWVKLRTKWGIKRADLITCGSQALMDSCIKKGADKNTVHITGEWGVDLNKFNRNGDKVEIRLKLGLPENYKIILSPRNTAPLYNLDNIVMAIPAVTAKVKDVCFVFFWGGHDSDKEKELIDLAAELGVKNAIIFAGYITSDKVPLYHKASDIMVSISQYDSGPMALKEAMACGDVPVISNLPSVRELVKDGWNGILVDPNNVDQIADSIIDLLQNDTKRERFTERNWKLIQEKGDQEYWMGKMEKLYYTIIDG